jgi:hypothetical protein
MEPEGSLLLWEHSMGTSHMSYWSVTYVHKALVSSVGAFHGNLSHVANFGNLPTQHVGRSHGRLPHYVHKSLSLVPILSQINPVHTAPSYIS